MKQRPYIILSFLFSIAVIIVYTMKSSQYEETGLEERERMETIGHPFDKTMDSDASSARIGHLPHGIVHAKSDLELKPLWFTKSAELEERVKNQWNLLAISVGIKQKSTVDAIVRKFFPENFTIMLFHYDGNVNGWHDFWWSEKVIHVAAAFQTKWWFAKRFLHPDVVSIYDYIFLWDEDLGVDNFHPGRYLKIVKSEGLEISQPALDPDLSEIHHQLTARRKKGKVHRRILGGHRKCTSASEGPPCTGWVEGMAPVFSQSAWRCAWHLIQNDLVHGWGMDMKLGYCAQGDRARKVGVVDSEFIVHQGVQTLGGSTVKKSPRSGVMDARVEVRKQARLEFQTFQRRWNQAAREDDGWIDPFPQVGRNQKQQKNHVRIL